MEEKRNNKKSILLALLGICSLVLITAGVTYSLFTYTKLGETDNTITTGNLKFLYTENTGVGKGILISNALPVADSVGKAYSTDGYVFDFQVQATNGGTDAIPYEITLRQKDGSTLDNSIVKVYLTDMTGNLDQQLVAPTLFNKLADTQIDVGDNIEKTLYQTTVAAGEVAYQKDYRLRMWIDESANFSSTGVDSEGNPIYPYNGKTFTATVNVYANVPTVVVPNS